jgi:alginate O-acetyltransferase complex protein AlgI
MRSCRRSNSSERSTWEVRTATASRLSGGVLFNSFPFLLAFLPVVAVAYFALPHHRLRLLLVIGASYYFYAYADWWFPALMAGSTAIGYTTGRLLERNPRKAVLAAGIIGCLGLLAYFKYATFAGGYALDFVHVITGRKLPHLRTVLNGIVLPIGISFYTFEGISYMVDVYRGTLRAERDLLRYAFFISFFPHLIAGPIVRYGILQPQLTVKHRFDADRVRSGLLLFALGLAKKVLLADGIAAYVDRYLSTPGQLGFVTAWSAAVGFGFQIYFDFSAYSDMALGLARIFGIELPWNFDRPYRSASPTEFWRRWHVTLSSWLRDYLYIPLGGNRKGEARRNLNLFLTMALGGLWHGAALNFAAWGTYHGVLLAGTHEARERGLRLPRPLAVAVTFVLVVLGWVLFRMRTIDGIGALYAGMLGLHGFGGGLPGHLLLYIVISFALVFGLPEEWRWPVERWRAVWVAAAAVLFAVAVSSVYTAHPFIYFRF